MSDGLTLEKQRIADRLVSLENTINIYMATTELKIRSQEEVLDKLNHIIVGNGQEGIAETVRNLKKTDDNRKKHYFAFYVAIISGFGEWVWQTVTHWGGK